MSTEPDQPAKLLVLAQEDLAVARLIDREGLSPVALGFHCQQAVEKALKAVLAAREGSFPFTHDIEALIELCERAHLELPAEIQAAERLSPYAGAARYGLGDPATVAPADAIRWAALTVRWAEAQTTSRSN
ncbi:MAG TPA: HEPN domain-containing protein [Solirubrobacterales bacterium]|nr:HEPN domain-containing protein [Solirubrobacterales bacterium]